MTPPIIDFPAANAYKFVRANATFDSLFNSRPFDAELFENNLRPWQTAQPYAKKVTFDQEVSFQCHDNALITVAKLLDDKGKIVALWPPVVSVQVAGKVIRLGGTDYPAKTRHFVIPIALIPNLQTGNYRLITQSEFDTNGDSLADTTVVNVSELLYIAATHPNTIVIQYSHSRNAHGLIFTQTGARFTLRVEGWVGDYKPDSRDVAYEDQQENPLLLSSIISRQWGLHIGDVEGVPEHVLEECAYALGCDNVRIEDVQYLKEVGAKWEKTAAAGSPKGFGRIAIKEAKNQAGTVRHAIPDIELFSLPVRPYFVHSLRLVSAERTVWFAQNTLIETAQQETDLLNSLNAYGRALNQLNGRVYRVGNSMYYRNAHDEGYTSVNAVILTSYFTVTRRLIHMGGGAPPMSPVSFTLHAPFASIDWADGTLNSYGDGGWSTFVASHSHRTANLSNGILERNVRVFYFGTLFERFGVIDSRLRAIFGQAPPALQNIAIHGGGLVTAAPFFAAPFTQLGLVSLKGALSQAQVDGVFNNIAANAVNFVAQGSISTAGQTPPTPPSVASAAARTQLQNAGINITTD